MVKHMIIWSLKEDLAEKDAVKIGMMESVSQKFYNPKQRKNANKIIRWL